MYAAYINLALLLSSASSSVVPELQTDTSDAESTGRNQCNCAEYCDADASSFRLHQNAAAEVGFEPGYSGTVVGRLTTAPPRLGIPIIAFIIKTEEENLDTAKACEDFYTYACPKTGGGSDESAKNKQPSEQARSHLTRKLFRSIREILQDTSTNKNEAPNKMSGSDSTKKHINAMAKELYAICIKDEHKQSKSTVKDALLQILLNFGFTKWPLDEATEETYKEVLEKAGLRVLATITAVPDREQKYYTLTMNVPHVRFAPFPHVMAKIETRETLKTAYKNFIISVLNLFFNEARTTHSGPEGQPEANQIASEIIEVEKKLSDMSMEARKHAQYEKHTVSEWEKKMDTLIFSALGRDVAEMGRELEGTDEVGIHLVNYFDQLLEYIKTLEVKKLKNFIGWCLVREVADVMTLDVRRALNSFLDEASKPRIAVRLDFMNCIEKFIGYYGLMEKAIEHLYLKRFFNEDHIKKAFIVVDPLKAEFSDFISRNTWMDDQTKSTTANWAKGLQYHVGASKKLLDKVYIEEQYDKVKLPQEGSPLLLYCFAYRENKFLQMLKNMGKTYIKTEIWPLSPLGTTSEYYEHYTSVEIPAGALQRPIFTTNDSWSQIFGAVGSLTAGTVARGITEEGRIWDDSRPGTYEWTSTAKAAFKHVIKCLKEVNKNRPCQGRDKRDSFECFESKGNFPILAWKVQDHIGLRASFAAHNALLSKCMTACKGVDTEELKKRNMRLFFRSFVKRYCNPDATVEDKHRVNFVMKTFNEFSFAFGCPEGSKMKGQDTCQILPRHVGRGPEAAKEN